MVRPIPMRPVTKPKPMDFEGMIDSGQHPNGFTAQTANGTAKSGSRPGWNRQYKWPTYPEVTPDGAWTSANRTGE